jgi:hypothetical protein
MRFKSERPVSGDVPSACNLTGHSTTPTVNVVYTIRNFGVYFCLGDFRDAPREHSIIHEVTEPRPGPPGLFFFVGQADADRQ